MCAGTESAPAAHPLPLPQAAGEPPGLSAIEMQRFKALKEGDADTAARAELGIVCALLGAQFGPARVDVEQVREAGRGSELVASVHWPGNEAYAQDCC